MSQAKLAELFAAIETGKPLPLDPIGSWDKSMHVFDERTKWALRAAVTARRPLLITGEPGSGKSQLARAAAQVAGRAFLFKVVDARTESRDLQYQFDSVARLGEAQALAFKPNRGVTVQAGVANNEMCEQTDTLDPMDPRCFLAPEVLWWAFDWNSAKNQAKHCRVRVHEPGSPEGWTPEEGCVLLIDEIDKAEQDLPNGLLETLGNGAFPVPYLEDYIGLKKAEEPAPHQPPPLVFITSNGERELPAAFVRRCMVLHLDLYKEKEELTQWLAARGEVHQPKLTISIRKKVAEMLYDDRLEAQRKGLFGPGQAEYLDILKCLAELSDEVDEQEQFLDQIREFAFAKARRV